VPLSAILALAASAAAPATNSKLSEPRALLSLKSSYTRGPQLNASLRIVKRQIPYKQFTGVAASKGLYLAHWQERPRTNWPYVFVLGGSRVDHAKALDARRWTEVVQRCRPCSSARRACPSRPRGPAQLVHHLPAERRQLSDERAQEGRGARHAPLDGAARLGGVRKGPRRAHAGRGSAGGGRVRRALRDITCVCSSL
jgi:hypothetical protein